MHYDILINNAGAGVDGDFTQLPLNDQLQIMRLNMNGSVALSHPYLAQARKGDVLKPSEEYAKQYAADVM